MSAAGARSRDTIALAGVVNLAGGVTGAAINVVLAALVGRHLGAEGVGAYFLVVAVFVIVANVSELGADTGLVKFVSAARATGRFGDIRSFVRIAVRPVLIACAAVAAIGVLASPWVSRGIPGVEPWLIAVAAVVVTAATMTAVMLSLTRGLGDVVSFPLFQNVTLPLLRVVAVAGVVIGGGGVMWVLVAWLTPAAMVAGLATLVAVRLLVRSTHGHEPDDAAESTRAKDFWAFSAARGVAAAVEILLEWMDVLLVGWLAGPAEAGIYAVVTRCVRAGEVAQQAGRIAVGPQISAAFARGALDSAREIYGLVSAAMVWLAFPFFILLAVFGDSVLAIFGPEFAAGHRSLTILAVSMAVATAAGTVQSILLMGGKSGWQLADKSFALALSVVLNLILIPVWGIEGAATAWAVTIVLDTAIVVWQVQRLMGIRPPYAPLAWALGLSLGVVGGGAVVARMTAGSSLTVLAMTTALVGLAYLVASFVLKDRLGLVRLVRLKSQGDPA